MYTYICNYFNVFHNVDKNISIFHIFIPAYYCHLLSMNKYIPTIAYVKLLLSFRENSKNQRPKHGLLLHIRRTISHLHALP